MDGEIQARIEQIQAEDERQNKRIELLESDVRSFQQIAISVEKLAINMENMLAEQKKQGERLNDLEAKPAQAWNNMQKTIFNTSLGAIIAVVVGALIWLVAQYAIK